MINALATYKTYLKVTGATLDTPLTALAEEAEGYVKDYLNRDIESATYTEYYDGSGRSLLTLNQYPITTLTSVSVYDSADETWDLLVLGTDYDRSAIRSHAIYLDGYTFVKGIENYKVVYIGGYTTVPKKIQLVCKKVMKILYDQSPLGEGYLGYTALSNNVGGSQNINVDLDALNRTLKEAVDYRALNV